MEPTQLAQPRFGVLPACSGTFNPQWAEFLVFAQGSPELMAHVPAQCIQVGGTGIADFLQIHRVTRPGDAAANVPPSALRRHKRIRRLRCVNEYFVPPVRHEVVDCGAHYARMFCRFRENSVVFNADFIERVITRFVEKNGLGRNDAMASKAPGKGDSQADNFAILGCGKEQWCGRNRQQLQPGADPAPTEEIRAIRALLQMPPSRLKARNIADGFQPTFDRRSQFTSRRVVPTRLARPYPVQKPAEQRG